MRVYYGSMEAENKIKKPVLTLGVFDGVHRGHREIIDKIIKRAKQIHGTSVVYTFEPHPVKLLAPHACPLLLQTVPQKIQTIKDLGVQACIIEPFNHALAELTPANFFQKILIDRIKAEEIFVGYDFTFGSNRTGTIETMEQLGKKHGIKVHIVKAFLTHDLLISSTQIRQLIAKGDVNKGKELLGRPYAIEGHVIRGRGVGKKLGFHTANLKTANELLPSCGVYITETLATGRRWPSLTNIGNNPTFGGTAVTVETHLLKFNRNIIGKHIQVAFLKRLRDEIAFVYPAELTMQINKDVQKALEFFKKVKGER